MVTVGWLSEAVEKIWDFLVGTTVFLESVWSWHLPQFQYQVSGDIHQAVPGHLQNKLTV